MTEPITHAEIEAVRERCNIEPVNLADTPELHQELDLIVAPSLRSLSLQVRVCEDVYYALLEVLIMGVGIGARVIEARTR